MWIYFTGGFVSVVHHNEHRNTMHVRARSAEHLENFISIATGNAGPMPRPEVTHTPQGDYHYRCDLPTGLVQAAMFHLVNDIDYQNFKNAAREELTEDELWMNALYSTWAHAHAYQTNLEAFAQQQEKQERDRSRARSIREDRNKAQSHHHKHAGGCEGAVFARQFGFECENPQCSWKIDLDELIGLKRCGCEPDEECRLCEVRYR